MSKRKIGGYVLSDDEDPPAPPAPAPPAPKKSKYAPVKLTSKPFKKSVAAQPAPPTSSHVPTTTTTPSQAAPIPAVRRALLPTPRHTPNPTALVSGEQRGPAISLSLTDSEEEESDTPQSPVVDVARTKGKTSAPNAQVLPAVAGPSRPHRTSFGLERDLDELSVTVTECDSRIDSCESKLQTQAQEIVVLRGTVNQLETTVETLTATVSTLDAHCGESRELT